MSDAPRIAPLEIDQLSPELLSILDRMAAVNAAIDSRDKEMVTKLTDREGAGQLEIDVADAVRNLPEIVRTMLKHPALFAVQTDIGVQLLGHGTIPARLRELSVLRIGWLCRAPYEWGEHVLVAKKVGLTSAEIARVTQGSRAEGWSDLERAILCATEELHATANISDATWAALAAELSEPQLIELPVLIGQYQTVAYYQNALRLRLHEGNDGLNAR